MRGKFPANVREADLLEFVVVDRFDGRDGRQFESYLGQAIGAPGGRPDGFLTGGVTTGVDQSTYQGSEERCVEWKDGKVDGSCLKRAQVKLPCIRRIINLTVSVRLIRTADNVPVWSDTKPRRDEVTWCQGRNPSRTVEEAVSAILRDVAQAIRLDVRPSWNTYKVRFREDRDGMPKEIGNAFKDVVKLSQKDLAAACGQWGTMSNQLTHPSILYNLGVCAESSGAYTEAAKFYRAAQDALGKQSGDIRDSINRVDRLLIARADDAEIARRRGRR